MYPAQTKKTIISLQIARPLRQSGGMKIPQYSLKRLFQLMAVCALPALIAARAFQGVEWAKGVAIGMAGVAVGLIVVFASYAWSYAVAYVLFRLFARRTRDLPMVTVEE